MEVHAIEEIIEDIKMGRPVVMIDDEDRENEGDVIIAAEKTTPELINFMVRHARGLVCLPLTQEKCKQLKLPLMVDGRNGTKFGTNFTLSIEAKEGVTTGISAFDRAKTILTVADPKVSAEDIVQPGHVFPIMAQPGGVLARAGHTEASVDLARLAGLQPMGVICEIMNENGSMARGEDLIAFCKEHDLKIGTIADLIAYRLKHEPTVHEIHQLHLPTALGTFEFRVFEDKISGLHHYAFVKPTAQPYEEALVRVHLHEPLLDLSLFSQLRPDHLTVENALAAIDHFGVGALVLLSQPSNQRRNLEHLGFLEHRQTHPDVQKYQEKDDFRLIGVGSQILSTLGFGKIRVLGAEKRYYGLSGFGLEVVGFQALSHE